MMPDDELAERLVKILQARFRVDGGQFLKVVLMDTFMKTTLEEKDFEKALNYVQSAGWVIDHGLTIELTEEGVKAFA